MTLESQLARIEQEFEDHKKDHAEINAKLEKFMPAIEAYNTAIGIGKFTLFIATLLSIGVGIILAVWQMLKKV